MATITTAWTQVHPSFIEPDLLLQITQASGAFDLLSGSAPRIKLGEGDQYVYVRRVDLRTTMAAGQAAYNQLPNVNVIASMVSTATYLLRVRAEYDHHDTAAAANWNIGIVDAHRLGMRQGHFQLARVGLLYGFNPQNGEGLMNAQGATTVSLPADTNGNQTVSTYDNGQMAFFLLGQIGSIKARTNQLGIGRKFCIVGPQRDLQQWEYAGIVQLVQYQRTGAGSQSTAGLVRDVLLSNGDQLMWGYDDTLISKGASSTDAIIIAMPEVAKPEPPPGVGGQINTNEFAKLAPGLEATTLMYADMAAPREIPTPIPGGAIDILSEWRVSSGWGIRPEAITIVSASP